MWYYLKEIKGFEMKNEWRELTDLTRGQPLVVERVRLAQKDIALEGSFQLPPLAQLSAEDQVFVMAFIRSHGSIKQMEKLFGISYPTVKNRLNRIAQRFEFVEIDPPPPRSDVLDRLEKGEISAQDAIDLLKK